MEGSIDRLLSAAPDKSRTLRRRTLRAVRHCGYRAIVTLTVRPATGDSIATRLYGVFDRMRDAGLRVQVQRSDFVLRLAMQLLDQRWQPHGRAPELRVRPSALQSELLDRLLDAGFEQLLVEAADACNQVMREVTRLLAASGLANAPGEFSERTAVWVRRRWLDGRPPTPTDCAAFALEMITEIPPKPLTAAGFQAAFTQTYDEQWSAGGAANLERHPPRKVGLGRDRRPPLLQADSQRRDWSQGTNRPVFERYRLWFKKSAQTGPPRCASDACQVREPAVVDDPAVAEVSRACDAYGLAHPAHHRIVRSLSIGMEEPVTNRGWTTWQAWAEPCQPIAVDDAHDLELADAVASAFAAWTAGDVGGPLVKEYGLQSLSGPLRMIVVRKAWMDLLGYERAFAAPMQRCGIPKTIRASLYRLAQKALPDWLDGKIGDPDDLPDDAWARTVTLLTEHPGAARLMMDEDAGWPEAYRAVADPANHLPADEALVLVQDLVGGMAR